MEIRLVGYFSTAEDLLRQAGIDPDDAGVEATVSTEQSFYGFRMRMRKCLRGVRQTMVWSFDSAVSPTESSFIFSSEGVYGHWEVHFVFVRYGRDTSSRFVLRIRRAGESSAIPYPQANEQIGYAILAAILAIFLEGEAACVRVAAG